MTYIQRVRQNGSTFGMCFFVCIFMQQRLYTGHGGRWRRICVVTLLKARCCVMCALTHVASGETLHLGVIDR
jgi:hypothetical protein